MNDNKLTYTEQLQNTKWFLKRTEILVRDNSACQKCGAVDNLQVHHKEYHDGQMAWEYNNIYLITLCRDCHINEHANNRIKMRYSRVITSLLEPSLIEYFKEFELPFKEIVFEKLLKEGVIGKRPDYLATVYYLINDNMLNDSFKFTTTTTVGKRRMVLTHIVTPDVIKYLRVNKIECSAYQLNKLYRQDILDKHVGYMRAIYIINKSDNGTNT